MRNDFPPRLFLDSDQPGADDFGRALVGERRLRLWAYLVALTGIAVTLFFRIQLSQVLGERGLYSTLLPTVILAAHLGGFWPGAVATLVGSLATNYLLVNHLLFVQLKNAGDSVALALFVITGFVISLLSESLHRAQRRILMDERRRAAESLEKSEKRFAHLVENSSDIISFFAPDGTILYQTPSVSRVLGYRPDQRLGRKVFENPIVHPDDLPAKRAFFDAMIEQPSIPVTAEFRLRHRDGSWRFVEAIGQNRLDEPSINGLIVNYRDITERKLADQTVRESEQRWRCLAQSLPQLIWTATAGGRSDYFSPQVLEYTGLPESALLEGGWIDTVPPDERDSVVEQWTAAVASQSRYDLEHRIRRKDGVYGWFKVCAVPLRGADGGITKWLGSCTDITESKELETQLRRLNRRLELAIRGSNIGIWEVDVENGRLNFERASFVNVWEQLGYESAAARNGRSTPNELVHPDDLPRMEQTLQSYLAGETAEFECEHRSQHRDGGYRWMLMRGVTIWDDAVAAWRFTGTSIDISILKEAEHALREAKDAAESANRAKDEFLANVSHEIRTPMNAILGMTELVLETALTASQQRLLQTVKSAGGNLMSIINDLLDFSKIGAGKLHLDPAVFALRQTVGDVVRILASRAHAQGLELVCDIADSVPDHIVGDAGRLRQVLLNLVGNAIKFTPSGEVVVQVATPSEREDAGAVQVTFSVRDTGIGIPVEKQQAIFRAFEQEDTSTTRKYGGTGLGLTISSYLVQQMGGTIEVDSQPGFGSVFRFAVTFELGRAEHPAATVTSTDIAGRRILVVDDNETNRTILESWLRCWRMKPMCVADGGTALALLTAAAATDQPFDLVVLDRRMPDIDGIEVLRRIRRDATLADLTVILLTSGDPEEDEEQSKSFSIQARLTKPCLQSDLLGAIQNVLSHVEGSVPAASDDAGLRAPPTAVLRILVAEDNDFNSMLLEQLLLQRRHSVTIVDNGRLALERAAEDDFDVLLLDIHMPELDGFQVARAVREHEQTTGRRLPIIALTARSTPHIREQCLGAGMDDVVSKPMKADQLWAAIDRVVATDEISTPVDLIDAEMLLSVCGGSADILTEIIRSFLANVPGQLRQIQELTERQELPRLREAAHKLAGTLRAFSQPAGEEAIALEAAAEAAEPESCRSSAARLSEYCERLQSESKSLTIENLRSRAESRK